LSVSRRIVEEHGGWIEVGNSPGNGAAFTVWLPELNASEDRLTESGVEHERADIGR
jgi:signal transduction histidine kinase